MENRVGSVVACKFCEELTTWVTFYEDQVDAAAAKVKELRDDEGNPNLKLRVYITGGGCAGFSYGFTFDEAVYEDDTSVDEKK